MQDSTRISWYEWESQQSLTKAGKPISRIVKMLKDGFPGDLTDIIESGYPKYLEHMQRKIILQKKFKEDVEKENCVIMQVDFAMDYNCKDNASEIQSVIYDRKNVSIFNCAIHYGNKWHSFPVLKDADKYKSTVRLCMMRILQSFKFRVDMSVIDKVIIWSGGPSNEFRNQYVTDKVLHEIMAYSRSQ